MGINASRHVGQKGFTLIETLVVTIVGIVILAAAAAGIGKLFRSSEISTEAGNIVQMALDLKNLKSGAHAYSDLSNTRAMKLRIVPDNMVQDPGNGLILNAWNGPVFIRPDTRTDRAFSIHYTGLPPEACQQLALKLRNAGWSRVEAGAVPITPDTSLEDIGEGCKLDRNAIVFVS